MAAVINPCNTLSSKNRANSTTDRTDNRRNNNTTPYAIKRYEYEPAEKDR